MGLKAQACEVVEDVVSGFDGGFSSGEVRVHGEVAEVS